MTARALADYADRVLDLPSAEPPPGYHDLPLCVVDAVFSVGMTYTATRNAVTNFVRWAQDQGAAVADDPIAAGGQRPEYPVPEALELLGSRSDGDLAEVVFKNNNRTSSQSGILKARAVVSEMEILAARDIDIRSDLLRRAGDEELKEAWRGVRGQGSGISWRYLLMLAGHDEVKPDRMIIRFVTDALGRDVTVDEAADLMREAHALLVEVHPDLTLRAFDHAAWSHARSQ